MSQHDINTRVSQQIAELSRRVTELEVNRSSVESDRTPTHLNVTTASTHSLPGRDSERQPNETESSLTETLGIAETSNVATPSVDYSKRRPSGRFGFSPISHFISILPDLL